MSVRAEDVSVVVQGPVGIWLPDVLSSVRRHLPGAELILSSWQGTVPGGLDVDVLVQSVDPGSVNYRNVDGSQRHTMWNTNRMVASTKAGLLRATRPMVLKLRTDTSLRGSDLLEWWDVGGPRADRLRVFQERIVTISVATRPAQAAFAYLFHPSDCVHFGLTDDVRLLWEVDEVDEAANATFWTRGSRKAERRPQAGIVERYFNEQQLFLSALRAAGHDIDYPYSGYLTAGLQQESDLAIVNNFVVVESWQAGVSIPKLMELVQHSRLESYMHHDDWWRIRNLHCPAVV